MSVKLLSVNYHSHIFSGEVVITFWFLLPRDVGGFFWNWFKFLYLIWNFFSVLCVVSHFFHRPTHLHLLWGTFTFSNIFTLFLDVGTTALELWRPLYLKFLQGWLVWIGVCFQICTSSNIGLLLVGLRQWVWRMDVCILSVNSSIFK